MLISRHVCDAFKREEFIERGKQIERVEEMRKTGWLRKTISTRMLQHASGKLRRKRGSCELLPPPLVLGKLMYPSSG